MLTTSENAQTRGSRREADLEIESINWVTSIFLIATLVVALIATPLYVWKFGVGWMELTLFLSFFAMSGMSITVGYHRLFSHRAFNAAWPVRLFVALFGAAAFQMSILDWSSEHRYHHKYTDLDGDPHDPHSIKRGFLWAHIGWLLVRVNPRLKRDNVPDLRRDRIVMFQHNTYVRTAIVVGFLLPMALGALWSQLAGTPLLVGILGGFLFGGCTRIVVLQHATFFINSLAHMIGTRPYDSDSSARDSTLISLFTFGEGYHNYHHAFQTDYRNGIKKWHWDPSKWVIWSLSKVGLTWGLRRIPRETIRMAVMAEKRRRLEARISEGQTQLSDHVVELMQDLEDRLEKQHLRVRTLLSERSSLLKARRRERRERMKQLGAELARAQEEFKEVMRQWQAAHRLAWSMATPVRA